MEWTFGTVLWTTLVFFFWFAVIWMFIGVFADIFRRQDLSGWAKAGWIILIVLLPFLGILIYLIARPRTTDSYSSMFLGGPEAGYGVPHDATDEIARAARLQDEGKITPAEYERLKRRALSF
jgi:hypothetical protein